jgi:flagellar biosynthesis/type III secretory pathway protein FliH
MRSLPDIFKAPWLYVTEDDRVLIPDFMPEEPALPEEEAADEGDAGEGGHAEAPNGDSDYVEGEDTDRRQEARRQTDRRAEDEESLESLKRRYREKLRLTREEFIDDIGPQLLAELKEQMLEVREEAFRDELIRQRAQIQQAIDDMGRGMRALEETHKAYILEYTEELKYMALDIAERILRKEIDGHKYVLEALALELVTEVKDAPWINVEVSEEVEGLAEYLRTQLNKAEHGKTIYVEAKDVPADSLRIATEEGVIDATISTQIRQLREAFVKTEREGDSIA